MTLQSSLECSHLKTVGFKNNLVCENLVLVILTVFKRATIIVVKFKNHVEKVFKLDACKKNS